MSMTISPPPEIKRSYPFVDLTKYIAAVMVIMIHTNPLGAAQDSWLYTFTYTILRNALPFFFLSSSYFFFKKRNWSKYSSRNTTLQDARRNGRHEIPPKASEEAGTG